MQVQGLGTTGSARHLAAYVLGADVVKNEITAHAVAVVDFLPQVRTVIEIGGQDSKIILLQEGVVVDFAMNTVCAAGTGSFLDQQASRLGISVEDFGQMSLRGWTVANRQRIGRVWEALQFSEEEMERRPEHVTREFTSGDRNALINALAGPEAPWTPRGWKHTAKPLLKRLGWKEPPVQDIEDDE